MSPSPSGRRQSTISDADDEGSPRGRPPRRAFDIDREQPSAKPNKMRTALNNLQRRMSPRKKHKKSNTRHMRQHEAHQPLHPIPAVQQATELSEDHVQEYITWEQHLLRDLRTRTPLRSPSRRVGTPSSTVTDIEDTPQRPSYASTLQSEQRLADVVSSADFDPFIDDQQMTNDNGTEYSLHSYSGGQDTTHPQSNISVHPLNTSFVSDVPTQEGSKPNR